MRTNRQFKKVVTVGLAAVMVLGGASSVFADGHGKGHDREDGQGDRQNISVHGNNNIILSFDDVRGGDVEWAMKDIASLASRQVFEGYDDGTFRPKQTITHIEAITAAVRLLGLEDKAKAEMNTQLNFKDADKVPAWAIGYVAVAAENNLFPEDATSVQPNKPADRLWATVLLVKALKLDDQAKADMNAQLSFRDANKIPAGAVGYVKVAVDKGLINGYEDNTFRPDRPVTRAEIAALLDRTGDLIPDNGTMTGTVTAAVYNNTVAVSKDGVTSQVTIDPNAFIFRDDVKVAATALQVGDQLKIRTYNNMAIFIDVTKDASQQPAPQPQPQTNAFTVTGTVYQPILSNNVLAGITINQSIVTNGTTTTQQVTYSVAPNVVISPSGAQLAAGQNVELQGDNGVVKQITLK